MPQVPLRFAALAPIALLAACGPSAPEPGASPTSDAAGVSTDWTAQNPTDPAVPVILPTTRMTNERVEATGAPK